MTIPLLRGMADITADYDALILDLWGVVYDGIAPFPGVLDCLAELRRAGIRVTLLSNAPRLAAAAAERLGRAGVESHLYDRIITSGDATRQALERRDEPFYAALGPAYYFLGKEADAGLLQGLGYRRTEALEAADFLLVTGGLLADAWGVERTLAPDQARLEAACREADTTPTAAIAAFVW